MKKLLVLLFLTSFSINSADYLATLGNKHYNEAIIVENIIKYGEDGFNQNGYDINGFDRNNINKETGTEYDNEGYNYLGLSAPVCEYNSSSTRMTYCNGCNRVTYDVRYQGQLISSSYSFSVEKDGKLLTKGTHMRNCGQKWSTCSLCINVQQIKQ